MKADTREQYNGHDNVAAIGIGAMIVFIALILVAAVASAVIIQTGEKLQQNAQKAGDDTSDEMSGKILILNSFVDTAAPGESYMFFTKLAAGSDNIGDVETITFQIFCENGVTEGALADADVRDMDDGQASGGVMNNDQGYIIVIDGNDAVDCSPDAVANGDGTAMLYLHVPAGGTTYETLNVDDDTAGATVT